MDLGFSVDANAIFAVTIGPFGADVTVAVDVDDGGKDLSIQLGLDDTKRYYLPPANSSFVREGFVFVPSTDKLLDEVVVTLSGRAQGSIKAKFRTLPLEVKAKTLI